MTPLVMWAVKGPDGISPNSVRLTKGAAQAVRDTYIASADDPDHAADTLEVVSVIVAESAPGAVAN